MKKIVLILMLGVFAFGSSGFKVNEIKKSPEPVIDQCYLEALEIGDFMDGYNGRSGDYYAFVYMVTFCVPW